MQLRNNVTMWCRDIVIVTACFDLIQSARQKLAENLIKNSRNISPFHFHSVPLLPNVTLYFDASLAAKVGKN